MPLGISPKASCCLGYGSFNTKLLADPVCRLLLNLKTLVHLLAVEGRLLAVNVLEISYTVTPFPQRLGVSSS